MKFSISSFAILTSFAVLGGVAGCGGGSNLPSGDTGTVRGRVTYNGNPVPAGCTVVFTRDEDGLLGTGTVDSSGDYLLRMRDGLKIVVGVYRVSVSPPDVAANLDQDEIMRLQQAGKLPDPAKVKEVPLKYRSPEDSTLICDVQPGANTFDIDMKD
ncbi:hypothetical protein GC163_10130 [bacterium]|nr:hypothetical protein [bacterium]